MKLRLYSTTSLLESSGEIKIYHTETQEDYDALMVELEEQGCKWAGGDKPSEINRWRVREHLTCVDVCDSKITYASLSCYKEDYPNIPITKYKAKVEEKMKFTKENVLNLTDKWIENKTVSFQDLQNQIKELDDTPEKVVVPKFVADVFRYEIQESMNIPHVLSAAFSEVSSKKNIKFLQWVKQYPDKYVMVVKYGYTIEPEKLYYIPLPHLETSDGIQQVLSKRDTYFASRPNDKLKQRYTKEELEQVPGIYKPFAKPIEGEM